MSRYWVPDEDASPVGLCFSPSHFANDWCLVDGLL